MIRIQNITTETIQRHTIIFEQSEVILTLRFLPPVQSWVFDAEYKDWAVYGERLAVGVLHIESQNQPFDFYVNDRSNEGLDPFKRDDFSTRRCDLYMLEAADMEDIRGAPVPI